MADWDTRIQYWLYTQGVSNYSFSQLGGTVTYWDVEGVAAPSKAALEALNDADLAAFKLATLVQAGQVPQSTYTFKLTGPWTGEVDYTLHFSIRDGIVTMDLPALSVSGNGSSSAAIQTTTGLVLLRPAEDWVALIPVVENGAARLGKVRFLAADGTIKITTGVTDLPFSANSGKNGWPKTTVVYKK